MLELINGFEKIDSHQDGVVLLKLLAQGYQIDIVREFLVNYYAHSKENGITGVTQKTINADEEYYNYCRKYFNLLSFNERILVTKKYYSLNIKRLLLIGDKCKALKVIKKAREEKFLTNFFFEIHVIILFWFFYCIYDNYVQLKFRK